MKFYTINSVLLLTSLQRIIENSTVAQDRDAAKQILEQRKLEREKTQYKEQLAQNLKTSRTLIKDFNRTINDYFFNLAQRIKEARLETKTLISKIFAGSIKSQLKQALIPGSESFVNGMINGIQGILDQAQSLVEKELGQSRSLIQLETESHSLEREMQDFIRSVNGATDAVSRFANAVNSNQQSTNSNNVAGSSNLVFPLPGLTLDTATITSGFGRRRIFGRDDFHEGLDFAVPGGTDVLAVREGVVKNVKPLADQMQVGVKSINDAGQEVVEWFIHLSKKLEVKIGDRVFAGQKIGEVAHTTPFARQKQVSTGDHLDYRVTVDNQWVEPSTMLRGVGKGKENTATSNLEVRAREITQQYIRDKKTSIELNRTLIGQEKELLSIQSNQQLGAQKRQFETQQREGTRSQFTLSNRLAEFADRGELATASIEFRRTIRQTQQQFRDLQSELKTQKIRYSDTADSMQKFIELAHLAVAQSRARGDEERAVFLEKSLAQFQTALPVYLELLSNLDGFEQQLLLLQQKVTAELKRQGQLKIEAEVITKRSAIQQIKTTISTQRGTNELRRQNELATERLRLEQKINEIKQKYGDTDYAKQLIQLERQNSLVNEQKIDLGAVERERQYERQLIDLDSGIKNKRGDRLTALGLTFKGNAIKREAERAQENFRYQQRRAEIEKTYAGDSEKIEELLRQAEELNRVNLENIKQQFKSLGQTILDSSRNGLATFFENSLNAFADTTGEGDRAVLEQQLQYKEELLALEDKYRDNPNGLDFAKQRVRELNEEKLDKIKKEFGTFNRVVNFARQAVIALLKEILRMIAIKAAASIFSAIIGGGAGAAVSGAASGTTSSMNFDGGSGAFTAMYGATVPDEVENFKTGGTPGKNRIVPTPISNELQRTSSSVRSAFRKEGRKGVLGVFTPGEEILSIKTGEALRYQSLKKRLGTEPLEKVFKGNFREGGTIGTPNIEGNLLRGLDLELPKINLRAIGDAGNQVENNVQNITNFSATIVTPDADSFRESSYQRQQDIAEALIRSGS